MRIKVRELKKDSYKDVCNVLEIQLANHKNVLPKEKRGEGFVTLLTPPSYLKSDDVFCFIAKDTDSKDKKMVGYIICVKAKSDLKNHIIDSLKEALPSTGNEIMIVAQICVESGSRGNGIAQLLYAIAATNAKANSFQKLVTEIDVSNEASLKAHKKAGFKKAKKYQLDGQTFQIIEKVL